MDNKNKKTAKWFSEQRKRTGLSQRKFAQLIGISPPHACNIEKGNRGLQGKRMLEIEKILNQMRLK